MDREDVDKGEIIRACTKNRSIGLLVLFVNTFGAVTACTEVAMADVSEARKGWEVGVLSESFGVVEVVYSEEDKDVEDSSNRCTGRR